MNIKEYQEQSKRTCPSLGSYELDLSHMALGMCSELQELDDAYLKFDKVNVSEELADIMWYNSNLATFLGIDLKQPKLIPEIANVNLEWYIFEVADVVKKCIAYNKQFKFDYVEGLLNNISLKCLEHLNWCKPTTFNQILQNNIDKLKIRYPNKFTQNNAINRNLDLERKELEK